MPARALSHDTHPHLTFPRVRQQQCQLRHWLTTFPVSSSKRTVSIKSNKPAPDASFFHHSFQAVRSSKQSHLYLLHRAMPSCHCVVVKIRCTQDTYRNLGFRPVHRCWRISRHYCCKNTLDRLTKEWLKSLKDQGGEWQSFLNLHFLLFSKKRNKIYIKDAIEIYKV